MIAAWMLFAIEIGALLFAAAWVAERALLIARRPVRVVWVIAIISANLLPLLVSQIAIGARITDRWALSVASQSVLSSISLPLLALWAIAFAIGLFVCLSAIWRMARTRPSWKNEHVDETPVLVSHDIGPALVGVMHYSIVVPHWAYSLEAGARRLLLAHEREHARHYDPLLLAAAAFTVVIAPWNVFNWLFFRRLHLAVELDCDQRVLRAHPDARTYGALLLDVAERVLPSVMPAAAFVEHGASLETRINAMSEKVKTFRSLRVAGGLAVSFVLVTAACFTPRPYAIIIVNPPATGTAPVDPATTAAVRSEAAPLQSAPLQSARPGADQHLGTPPAPSRESTSPQVLRYSAAGAEQLSATVLAGHAEEIKPVAPSARVQALDAAEVARLRAFVVKSAPNTLGAWPRADSALLLIFDSNNAVVKQAVVAQSRLYAKWDALSAFSAAFTSPEVNGIESASEFMIDRGLRGETLSEPLKLYAAHLLSGLPVPMTRAEVIPSREAMLATVRARHPETLADTVANGRVSLLVYDSKGKLLTSAVTTLDAGVISADDPRNADYERKMWRRTFGTMMDSGSVMQSGTFSFLDNQSLKAGPTKIMYSMLSKRSDFDTIQALVGNRHRNWAGGSWASRPGRGRSLDVAAMSARLREFVQTRVPEAYGNWARGDSAVVLLLDAEDNLIARKAGSIPRNSGMQAFADYISLRVLTVSGDDIERAGQLNHVASPAGRILDKPLVVIWGRLNAEATRKLRQERATKQ